MSVYVVSLLKSNEDGIYSEILGVYKNIETAKNELKKAYEEYRVTITDKIVDKFEDTFFEIYSYTETIEGYCTTEVVS